MRKARVIAAIFVWVLVSAFFVSAQKPLEPRGQGKSPFPPAAKNSQTDDPTTLKVDVKLVNVFATVTDQSGAPITDLKKEDFVVKEDGHLQQIAVFEQESEVPLSIVLAVDASQSVGKDLKLELESARRFVASILRPVDQLAIYRITESVSEVVPFTSNMARIERGLQSMRLGAATALYDAIFLGGKALMGRGGRKVIVIITDGGDTVSASDFKMAVRAAQQAEAIVYSIVVVPVAASAGRNTGGEHALIQLAKDTGGKYFYADLSTGLDAAFARISRELRTQYLLGYYPSRRLSDSDFRQIQVAISRASAAASGRQPAGTDATDSSPVNPSDQPPVEYIVRHRSGYYTSKLE